MAEYIKREDVLEFSRILDDQLWETGGYRNYPTEAVPVDAIRNIPSADVAEVKHGRWIKTVGENGVISACRCSNCGFEDNRYSLFNYCPRCGARMDVEHE